MSWDSIAKTIVKGAGEYMLSSLEDSAHRCKNNPRFNDEEREYYANAEERFHNAKEHLHSMGNDY